ncbi:OsmC family peroxiredoxin [Pimelobacter simplex]|uniref:OsmC/Ohr family protein n=1 Tax=Nocardioides simplex TaxID=2045 RepID=A0A0A1DMS3_NOCSI|nr:OsmC family protein [Pimelobacter simplex]AIY18701.1 OsmC/Ohr family protein [Pimelobacter simplex]MCG8152250.1 OsmC family peroxiredoxin [Pimelobacter simplex]GEB14367.1 peroxiredoxin [Pimelobacter simplex]SFM30567.1 Organic hydroperoxide reductase OsmC/OhrA [Pimelobacter simplex]
MTDHHYALDLVWQGNRGSGTSGYRDYDRTVLLTAAGKPDLLGSADPTFRGDAARWNPEELLLAALAQCHLLSYLHSAVNHGVVVTAYDDSPVGTMTQSGQGGRFTSVTLRPRVTVADATMVDVARAIHAEASENCFIAASVSFPVGHEPVIEVAG